MKYVIALRHIQTDSACDMMLNIAFQYGHMYQEWLMGFGISIHTSDGFNSSISELTIVDRNDITTKVKNYVVNVMDYTMAYNCCYNDNAEDLKMYLPNFSRSYLEKLLKYCNEHQKLNCLIISTPATAKMIFTQMNMNFKI